MQLLCGNDALTLNVYPMALTDIVVLHLLPLLYVVYVSPYHKHIN